MAGLLSSGLFSGLLSGGRQKRRGLLEDMPWFSDQSGGNGQLTNYVGGQDGFSPNQLNPAQQYEMGMPGASGAGSRNIPMQNNFIQPGGSSTAGAAPFNWGAGLDSALNQLSPRYAKLNRLYGAGTQLFQGNIPQALNTFTGGTSGKTAGLLSQFGAIQPSTAAGFGATGIGTGAGAAGSSASAYESGGLLKGILALLGI